jgi:hypothetical protein
LNCAQNVESPCERNRPDIHSTEYIYL